MLVSDVVWKVSVYMLTVLYSGHFSWEMGMTPTGNEQKKWCDTIYIWSRRQHHLQTYDAISPPCMLEGKKRAGAATATESGVLMLVCVVGSPDVQHCSLLHSVNWIGGLQSREWDCHRPGAPARWS
jgi:hypothetical protein